MLVLVLMFLLLLLLGFPGTVLLPPPVLLLSVLVQLEELLCVELSELGDEEPKVTEIKVISIF